MANASGYGYGSGNAGTAPAETDLEVDPARPTAQVPVPSPVPGFAPGAGAGSGNSVRGGSTGAGSVYGTAPGGWWSRAVWWFRRRSIRRCRLGFATGAVQSAPDRCSRVPRRGSPSGPAGNGRQEWSGTTRRQGNPSRPRRSARSRHQRRRGGATTVGREPSRRPEGLLGHRTDPQRPSPPPAADQERPAVRLSPCQRRCGRASGIPPNRRPPKTER